MIFSKKRDLLIGLFLSIGALYYTFKDVSFLKLKDALSTIHYIYIVFALLLITLSFIIRAIRWSYLIRAIKEVNISNLFSPLMIGFMGNMLPARAGELIRAYLLGKRENIKFSASFATIFIERLFDMILILLMLGGVLLFGSDNLANLSVENRRLIMKFGWLSVGLCFLIILFSYLILYYNPQLMRFIRLLIKPLSEGIRFKIIRFIDSFTEGLKILKDLKGLIIVLILSIGMWIVITISYYPLYLAMDLSHLPLISLITLVVIICIFIALLPTPGFIGPYHAACVVGLHNIYNVSEPIAAGFGIISWFVQMGTVIILGLFFIFKDNITIKEIQGGID
ncbi:MAG: flippase-like domain-containing protein [Nitrospinae bacterium]|nr:flippase-like domain-containing protein [Nitrospinota bacterium]